MDPNETLAQLRDLITAHLIPEVPSSIDSQLDRGDAIAELFGSLDEWLSNGGFLPGDWRIA